MTHGAHHFDVDDLPFGVARLPSRRTVVVTLIDGELIDLSTLARSGALDVDQVDLEPATGSLNQLLAAGRAPLLEIRHRLAALAAAGDERLEKSVVDPLGVDLLAPVEVGDLVECGASIHHAAAEARLRGPGEHPLPPAWRRSPACAPGRAGAVAASGSPVVRPCGPFGAGGTLVPASHLDVRAEIGFVIGPGSARGSRVDAGSVADHVVGLVLLARWAAQDQPDGGPGGGGPETVFATIMSPWVVTLDALEHHRTPGPPQDPPPGAYLVAEGDWGFDLQLEILLQTGGMRAAGQLPVAVSHPPVASLYWTLPQLLAQATLEGVPLRTGDVLTTGPVSGPDPGTAGTLAELAGGGAAPVVLPNGSTRAWVADGDTVVVRGWAGGGGRHRVTLGSAVATVLPARAGGAAAR